VPSSGLHHAAVDAACCHTHSGLHLSRVQTQYASMLFVIVTLSCDRSWCEPSMRAAPPMFGSVLRQDRHNRRLFWVLLATYPRGVKYCLVCSRTPTVLHRHGEKDLSKRGKNRVNIVQSEIHRQKLASCSTRTNLHNRKKKYSETNESESFPMNLGSEVEWPHWSLTGLSRLQHILLTYLN